MTNPKIYSDENVYNVDRNNIFFAHQVEICEKQKYEVVVRSDETSPSRNMLQLM